MSSAMLSRVADNLYWLGRYLERAEHAARLVGVVLDLRLDRDPCQFELRSGSQTQLSSRNRLAVNYAAVLSM